jgi:hypothetical protein
VLEECCDVINCSRRTSAQRDTSAIYFTYYNLHLLEPGAIRSSKRKSRLEIENCSKKSKLQHHSEALSKCSEEILSDDITLGLKRRLRLDEATPSKKIKQVDYNSGE